MPHTSENHPPYKDYLPSPLPAVPSRTQVPHSYFPWTDVLKRPCRNDRAAPPRAAARKARWTGVPSLREYAVLTDTVGFISDLPHQLVDAFSSTLEETVDADLLLHVVDISLDKESDGIKEFESNMKVTNDLLDSLGATKNRIVVYNKCDKITHPILIKDNEVLVSTKSKKGIDILLNKINENLFGE